MYRLEAHTKMTTQISEGMMVQRQLEHQRRVNVRRHFVLGTPAVLHHEIENDRENQDGEKQRDAGQQVIELVDLAGDGGSRGRLQPESCIASQSGEALVPIPSELERDLSIDCVSITYRLVMVPRNYRGLFAARTAQLSSGQRVMLAPEQEIQKNSADQNGQATRQLNHARNQQPVFAGVRIVVIAKQQNGIDGRADLSLRCFHQPQPHVALGILNAVKIARELALRASAS